MYKYATQERTIEVLKQLGFTDTGNGIAFEKDNFVALIYVCSAGYCCVNINTGDWAAPVVWDGPKASWDTTDTTDEFREFLETYWQ